MALVLQGSSRRRRMSLLGRILLDHSISGTIRASCSAAACNVTCTCAQSPNHLLLIDMPFILAFRVTGTFARGAAMNAKVRAEVAGFIMSLGIHNDRMLPVCGSPWLELCREN